MSVPQGMCGDQKKMQKSVLLFHFCGIWESNPGPREQWQSLYLPSRLAVLF